MTHLKTSTNREVVQKMGGSGYKKPQLSKISCETVLAVSVVRSLLAGC